MTKDKQLEGATCFNIQSKYNVMCERRNCRNWIPFDKGKNCVLIAVQDGPMTLQEIGKIYGLTRMRICQIEKGIYKKVYDKLAQTS